MYTHLSEIELLKIHPKVKKINSDLRQPTELVEIKEFHIRDVRKHKNIGLLLYARGKNFSDSQKTVPSCLLETSVSKEFDIEAMDVSVEITDLEKHLKKNLARRYDWHFQKNYTSCQSYVCSKKQIETSTCHNVS